MPPGLGLLDRLSQHPLANGDDLPGALGNRDEFARRHKPPFGVLPAQQDFGTQQAVVRHVDLRLEVQLQFLSVDGLAQGVFQLQAPHRGGLHFWREKGEAVASFAFGAVHGRVGAAVQAFEVLAVVGEQGNANRRGDRQLLIAQPVGLCKQFQQAARHVGCAVGRRVGQQGHEFIAAQPRHRVLLTQRGLDPLADLDQQLITRLVAKRVVHMLEMVQIDEQQAQRNLSAFGHAQIVLNPVLQQGAIGQAGERVVVGQGADAGFLLQAPADVAEDSHVVRHLAGFVEDAADGQPFRVFLAVAPNVPDFPFPVALFAQVGPHPGVKVGVMPPRGQHLWGVAQHFGGAVSGDGGEGRVDLDDALFSIGDQHAFAAAIEKFRRQPVLQFRQLARCDVACQGHKPFRLARFLAGQRWLGRDRQFKPLEAFFQVQTVLPTAGTATVSGIVQRHAQDRQRIGG